MENKFKVGDMVRFTKEMEGYSHGPYVEFDDKVRMIVKVSEAYKPYQLEGLERNWFSEKELELVNVSFTKSDLKDGDILIDREGCKSVYIEGELLGDTVALEDLNDYLKAYGLESYNDIVKVERPIKYETVYERNEEPKELTIKEISELLGYEIKLVKESK